MSSERHQGGWAASFIIVGAVLVLGLVGGVYYLKQQSGSREEAPVAVTAPEDNKQNDTPVERENNSGQPAPTQPGSGSSEESQRSEAQAQTAAPNPSAQLPETGPADTFVHSIAIVALTFAVTAYIQSRRQAFSL